MPAQISLPTRERIAQLHAEGTRINHIARELGLARGTVAKYVRDLDAGHARLAGLTEDELARLRFLATLAAPCLCPSCGDRYFVLEEWEKIFCDCGAEFERPSQSAGPRDSAKRSA